MKDRFRPLCPLVLGITIPFLLCCCLPVGAQEPTLARLSFWVSPERMAQFEAAYEKQLAPFLSEQGLVESPLRGRATSDSVFSRLFELASPAELIQQQQALRRAFRTDSLLVGEFGRLSSGGIKGAFDLYSGLAGPGRAVKAGAGERQGLWQNFDVSDGLSSPVIEDMLQDRQGNLWFGTRFGGVSRYDGGHFVTFTSDDGLPNDIVKCLLEDRDGYLWLGTSGGGVSRYDGERFISFTTADGLAGNSVLAIAVDRQGHLWFGTDGGVSRYDGERFTSFATVDGLAGNSVLAIAADRQGYLWFGTDGGVSRYDGERFTNFTTVDGLANNVVQSILQDRQGHLWFGSGFAENVKGSGVSRYDGKSFVTFTTQDGLADNTVSSIVEARDGTLWFGTRFGGVSRYDGKSFTAFTTDDGLVGIWVMSMLEDRDGYLWLGIWGGISRYAGEQSTNLTIEDGLVDNGVMSVLEARDGTLWFGTWNGVSRYDGAMFSTLAGMAGKNVWAILEDRQGYLWFGTVGSGVSRYDGQELITFTTADGLASDRVTSILEDRQGQLWFGTWFGGVSRYDGQAFVTFTTEDGLGYDTVRSMLEDRQGQLWFGTGVAGDEGRGVSRYDGQEFVTFTAEDGLAGNTVLALLEDREGHLWFGTEHGGVSRYDGQEFVTFTIEDGLTQNKIVSMLEDRDGQLWFGTWGGGVCRYDGLTFQYLLKRDGLANNTVQQMLQARNGDIWIMTEGGVSRYRSGHSPPSIRLADVVVDRRYGPVLEMRIPASQTFIAFEFQGKSFMTSQNQLTYVYRLEGREAAWRQTRQTRVEYTELPVGDYVFEVKAVDRDLNYSEPTRVGLQVHLPYERIAWLSALSLAVLLVVWQTSRVIRRDHWLRESNTALGSANDELLALNRDLQQANRETREATRRKSDFLARMSHDLRTPMNAIISFSDLIQDGLYGEIDEDMGDAVGEISSNGEYLLSLINDILDLSKVEAGRIEVRPEPVDCQVLVSTCAASVEPLIKPNVHLEEHLEDLPPISTDSDRLRRVVMNLLSNAVKFTEEGRIVLTLRADNGWYELLVEDTGVGIPAEDLPHIFEEFHQVEHGEGGAKEGTGLGLAIVRKSVEMLGGTIAADSAVGQGTTFTLRLRDYRPVG